MKRVCVFCGASTGIRPEYTEAARLLGRTLAERNIGLVYGGSRAGLLGIMAGAVLDAEGEVIGVIPKRLVDKEVAFTKLPDLRIVDTMHERKALMAELSDGIIALPGGMGMLDEFFEVMTWRQLGIHNKPCGMLNVCHYFDRLLDFLDYAVDQQFVNADHRSVILVDESPGALLDKLDAYRPSPEEAKWPPRSVNASLKAKPHL